VNPLISPSNGHGRGAVLEGPASVIASRGIVRDGSENSFLRKTKVAAASHIPKVRQRLAEILARPRER
jgi:hypothetical protein